MTVFADADYPADPYPGRRPDRSFVHVDGYAYELVPVPSGQQGCVRLSAPSGFVLADTAEDLDSWLAARGAPAVEARTPVLAYGSNACPSKITWLRENLGLTGPVVLIRARLYGFAAVWAAGVRARDGQRPVTLVPMPDAVEQHAVWLASGDQVEVLDAGEGADLAVARYRREPLPDAAVIVEGPACPGVQAYRGARADRLPRLVAGAPVRAFDQC